MLAGLELSHIMATKPTAAWMASMIIKKTSRVIGVVKIMVNHWIWLKKLNFRALVLGGKGTLMGLIRQRVKKSKYITEAILVLAHFNKVRVGRRCG